MSDPARYSPEQIFCGLKIYWAEELGSPFAIEPSTRIDQALKAAGMWEEIDLADFYDDLQDLFGFLWNRQDWLNHFDLDREISAEEWEEVVAPRFTFGALAEYIRERVEAVAIGPLTILGKPCLSAGVFRGLEKLVRHVDSSAGKFGPSTEIRERLRGDNLQRFYERLRWITEGRLPQAKRPGCEMLFVAAFVVCVAPIFVWPSAICLLVIAGPLIWIGVSLVVRVLNGIFLDPFGDIRTFGDLARFLAKPRIAS